MQHLSLRGGHQTHTVEGTVTIKEMYVFLPISVAGVLCVSAPDTSASAATPISQPVEILSFPETLSACPFLLLSSLPQNVVPGHPVLRAACETVVPEPFRKLACVQCNLLFLVFLLFSTTFYC